MSATKWIIGIIIVVALGVALWWYMQQNPAPAPGPAAQTQAAATNPAADTSDAAITQDAAAVDAQMQGLNSDSANVDSSLSDQPVQQSY